YAVQVILNRYYTLSDFDQLLLFPNFYHFLEKQFLSPFHVNPLSIDQLRERVRNRFPPLLKFEPIRLSLLPESVQFPAICQEFLNRILDKSVAYWGTNHPARKELVRRLGEVEKSSPDHLHSYIHLSHDVQSALEERFGPQASTKTYQEVFAAFTEVYAGLGSLFHLVPLLPPAMSGAEGTDPLQTLNRASVVIHGFQHSFKHNQIAHQFEVLQNQFQQNEEALKTNRQQLLILEAILQQSDEAIMVMQAEGKLVWVNEAAARLLTYTATQLTQLSLSDLFPAIEENEEHIDDLWEVNRNIAIGRKIPTKLISQTGERLAVWLQTDKLVVEQQHFFLLRISAKDQ
ncbi:MAG: PAS domain-containing protein, partial [Bacteroidota bacterium]